MHNGISLVMICASAAGLQPGLEEGKEFMCLYSTKLINSILDYNHGGPQLTDFFHCQSCSEALHSEPCALHAESHKLSEA